MIVEVHLSSFERRIEILYMLYRNRKLYFYEICKIFNISRNTAYEDICTLSRYAPIYTKTGINGGIFLLDGYSLDIFKYLSTEEENLLNYVKQFLNAEERIRISGIINRYSKPQDGT